MLMESCPSATNWQVVAKLRRPNVHLLQSLQAIAHGADTVQYFQFRKSRGGPEQFHGAVVDHEGSENTRVFHDVSEVGKQLQKLDALVGSDTPSKVGIIFDWNVRWALDDAKGFLQDKTGYEQTVINHYKAFWNIGIPVDVIDSTCSFDKYNLLVAPMLFLLREGVGQSINKFVQEGGTFVTTYLSGYVNESTLAFNGGFPGPLKETLGIWFEEIDALFPDEYNSIEWCGKSYRVFDLCELLHLQGATAIATYQSDFYAGYTALTVNQWGKCKAYCIAARSGNDLLNDFYSSIVQDLNIKPALDCSFPEGVTAQIRSNGKTDFVFVMNFTDKIKTVNTKDGVLCLAPFEARIIER